MGPAGRTAGPVFLGVLCAIGAAVAYGINIISTREAAIAGVPGPAIVVWRVLVTLVLLAPLLAWRAAPMVTPRQERLPLVLLVLVTAAMGVTYLSAVSFIPVTLAVVIFYSYPVLILLAAPFVAGEVLTPLRLLIALVTFVGLTAVVGPKFDELDIRGILLAGIAAVFTAAQFFIAARCRTTPLLPKLLWLHLGILPIGIAVSVATTGWPTPGLIAAAPWAIAITIAGYVVGIVLQMAALERIGAALAGLIFCLEPVISALGSIFWLGERLSAVQIVGGLLVVGAVATTILTAREAR